MVPDIRMPCNPVLEDNAGAAQLAQNHITNSNSKLIDVRHNFLREVVGRKVISVIHVPSPFQHTDFLNRAISRESFEIHPNLVMNLW